MTFNSETSVIPCDDSSDVPTVQFDFVPISELENKNKDTLLGWYFILVAVRHLLAKPAIHEPAFCHPRHYWSL